MGGRHCLDFLVVVIHRLFARGDRHLTKFWNDEYLASQKIAVDPTLVADVKDLSFVGDDEDE